MNIGLEKVLFKVVSPLLNNTQKLVDDSEPYLVIPERKKSDFLGRYVTKMKHGYVPSLRNKNE